MPAHIRLLRHIRKIEGRKHRIFLNAQERVAKLCVATGFSLSHLNFTPEAVLLVVTQKQIGASRTSRDNVMRLRVGDEIKEECDGEALAMFEVEAGQHVDEVVARSQSPVAICGIVTGIRQAQVAVAGNK